MVHQPLGATSWEWEYLLRHRNGDMDPLFGGPGQIIRLGRTTARRSEGRQSSTTDKRHPPRDIHTHTMPGR